MTFVESLSKKTFDYIPEALSNRLLETYAEAITQVNEHLNQGFDEERHKTESLVGMLNDRVAKDIDLAKQTKGFCSADTFISLGMSRMSYLPQSQRPMIELLYRIVLLGALENHAADNPRYMPEARTQVPNYEKGIAKAYTALHGGDAKEGTAFAASIRCDIENAVVRKNAR